jgi:hypothetical protein
MNQEGQKSIAKNNMQRGIVFESHGHSQICAESEQ